eukprot:1157143-Pelagomonas_calceolata.AAC.7
MHRAKGSLAQAYSQHASRYVKQRGYACPKVHECALATTLRLSLTHNTYTHQCAQRHPVCTVFCWALEVRTLLPGICARAQAVHGVHIAVQVAQLPTAKGKEGHT